MKTPPFLLGAALLFWGWQTDHLLAGTLLAIVLESPQFVKARWEFSNDDLSRIWTFCAVLFLAAIVYAFAANDGVSSFAGVFQDPNLNAQRRAGDTSARTAVSMIRWLPMVLFLFVAAQSFNTRETVPLETISLLARRRLRKARERGEAPPALRAINVTYPYLAICLCAACASTLQARTFFPGFSALILWALWPYRSRRFGPVAWGSAFAVALLLGYAGQVGIVQLQRLINNYNPQWFSRFSQRGFDPDRTRTALGHIGQLKLSGRIVIRLQTPAGQPPPNLLREASYRQYRSLSWLAGDTNGGFQYLTVGSDGTTWDLLPEKTNTASVSIACALPGQRALLPLPEGSGRLENLPDFVILSQNDNGAVLAEQAGLVIFDALYGPGPTIDSPPDPDTDLEVFDREKPALARVLRELPPVGDSRESKLQALRGFFGSQFSYSLWQDSSLKSGTNDTPLSRFLLETHSGHCEYFATATVLLLRQLGVPARYAVGYGVHEGSGDKYVVRQRDAHAWCLVWNAATSTWEDFDTTPASWIAEEGKRASMFQWLSDGWSRIKFEIAKLRWGETNLRRYLLWLLIPVLLFLLYQIIFRRRKRQIKTAGSPVNVRENRPGLDSEFYALEAKLSALGYERHLSETAHHWLDRVLRGGLAAGQREALQEVLRLHYRHRFDPAGLSGEDRLTLRQKIRNCLETVGQPRSST